jgi:hypothetical protein
MRWIQVMLADRARWRRLVGVKAVCTRPTPGISAPTLNIEDLLRRCHHLVNSIPANVRCVGVAAGLDRLYFG